MCMQPRGILKGPILHTSHSCISWCPHQVSSSTVSTTRMLEIKTGYSTDNHADSMCLKAMSLFWYTWGAGGEGEQPLDNLPARAGCRVPGASLRRSLSILPATRKGSISNQTPKEQQKCYSQPSCRLMGSCMVTKRDRHMHICPFRPAQQKQAQEKQLELPCLGLTNMLLAEPQS